MAIDEFTFRVARGHLDTFHGTEIGWLILDPDGAAAANPAMATVADLTGELSTDDAPGYERGTIAVVWDAELGKLIRDPSEPVPATNTSGGWPRAVVFFADGATDGDRELISLNPAPEGAGFADWDIDPANGIAIADDQADFSLGELSDVDLSTLPTHGQVPTWDAGDEKWKPGTLDRTPAPVILGADWVLDANRCIGVNRWVDQGRAGVDATNTHEIAAGAAPVPANAWTGLRPLGPFQSEVGATWPTLLDVRWDGEALPQRYATTIGWCEVFLATVDQAEDYLEPAFVQEPDTTWHIGLDFRCDGEDSERTFVSEHTYDPTVSACWRVVMDGTEVILYTKATGANLMVHTGWTEIERAAVTDLPMRTPGSETSPPYTLAAPPEGDPLMVAKSGALVADAVLLDDIDGDKLHRFRASDGAHDAMTVTTAGEAWAAAFGPLSERFPTRRLSFTNLGWGAEDPATFDVGTGDSFTIAFRGRIWPDAGAGGQAVVASNLAVPIGGPGWMLGVSTGFAFLVSDGTDLVVADAGARPTGTVDVVAVLDRDTDEVRVYIDGELEATADASALGAITSDVVAPYYGDFEWVAYWKRTLDNDEISVLTDTL